MIGHEEHAKATDTVKVEQVLQSGIYFIEGDQWRELTVNGSTLIFTHKAGSTQVEADETTVKMYDHLNTQPADRIRLVAANGIIEVGKRQILLDRDDNDHILRNMPDFSSTGTTTTISLGTCQRTPRLPTAPISECWHTAPPSRWATACKPGSQGKIMPTRPEGPTNQPTTNQPLTHD